jgi:mono/diheme cytochrome c family protein
MLLPLPVWTGEYHRYARLRIVISSLRSSGFVTLLGAMLRVAGGGVCGAASMRPAFLSDFRKKRAAPFPRLRNHSHFVIFHLLAAWAFTVGICTATSAAPAEAADSPEFFEKRVRPVLSDRCFKCHSSNAEKLKGGLMLDSREAILKGGDTGPAVEPGNPEKSLLIDAIHWKDKDMQMPPKKQLAADEVAGIEAWVRAGAPWPQDEGAKAAAKKVFNLQKRKAEHWCWQPLEDAPPPDVKATGWPANAVDRFILAKLEEKGLAPAPDADRRTLLRRVTFDITGLPPTPEEADSFASDTSPDAFAKVVDRLLASPHYGERWGRHWLDLVRYAETRGHEYDPAIPNAWQYRDYVVRALNRDLPYNQFAAEHIAGDLLSPRLNPKTGANEAILGTGFWFLGEELHSPVDIRQDEADRMDNRLDVMGKAFLGLTIGCARCHDHKFDAISQRDYYALQGFLISSGYRQARFETLETERKIARQLDHARVKARVPLLKAEAEAIGSGLPRLAEFLMAARELLIDPNSAPLPNASPEDTELLARWVQELKAAETDPGHPLRAFAKIAADAKADDPADFEKAFSPLLAHWQEERDAAPTPFASGQVVADYSRSGGAPWIEDGFGFGLRPQRAGEAVFGADPDQPLLGIATRGAAVTDPAWKSLKSEGGDRDVGKLGAWDRAGRTLRTPEVTLSSENLWYLVRGSGHAYAAINSHLIINGPLHGALLKEWTAKDDRWHWVEHRLPAYAGHRLHVEFSPAAGGELAIAMVVQADEMPPLPNAPNALLLSAFQDSGVDSPAALAQATQRAFAHACERMDQDELGSGGAGHLVAAGGDQLTSVGARQLANEMANGSIELADWMVRHIDLFAPAGSPARQQLLETAEPFIAGQNEIAAQVPSESHTAPAMFDGSGVDEFVLVRGQAKTPGAVAPRRFLEAIAGPDQPEIKHGSGRLDLARRIVDPSNPLTSRVIVNRVWHHLFGRGIVPTVDNFGVLGQPPSHRELLDYLALHFMRDQGWSLKKLIREIVLSRAYQMSSQPADAVAEQADPDNALLHRMNLRRLEGEAIRDAILMVSGRLDPKLGGPSVPVHLTEFMDGRGRPESGPLDGAGRRSIYIAVRRNFLPPMMLAFDTPIPFNCMGRRNISNVPSQALILMNDPFVVEQAKVWARRLPPGATRRQRVEGMYLAAFGRPPAESELADAEAFLRDESELYASEDPFDERVWADFAHVLFNVKEFIYLN